MSLTRRQWLRTATLAPAAWALGACGGEERSPRGTLTYLVSTEVEHLDPRFPADQLGASLSRLLCASLLQSDAESFLPRPALAQALTYPAPDRVRVALREGVRFDSGAELTAQDVAANYSALLDPAVGSTIRGAFSRVFLGVEALDARTVEFRLRSPEGTHPSLLQTPLLRGSDARGPELVVAAGQEPRFVASGAFRVARFGHGLLELERREPREGAPRRLRVLTVRDPNTMALRLLHGAADAAEVKPEVWELFAGRRGFALHAARSVATQYLGFNTERPPLDRLEVRRALALALDRATLARSKFGSHAVLATGLLPPSHWAYEGGVEPLRYDLREARAAVRSLGAASRPLVLRTASTRFVMTVAQALASMLEEAGLTVELRGSDLGVLLADLRAGRFDLALLQLPDVSDPWALEAFFHSASIPTAADPRAGNNRWRYRDAALDAALVQGRLARTPQERRPHYAEAQRLLSRGLPVVPLWHPDVVFASGPRVGSLRPRGDSQLDFLGEAALEG